MERICGCLPQSSAIQSGVIEVTTLLKMVHLCYTLSGVAQELPNTPVYPSFSPARLQLGACSHSGLMDVKLFVHNVGMHSTAIFLEKMGAKQGCWNGTPLQHLIRCTIMPHF